MAVIGIEGEFGSGKTSLSVYLASKVPKSTLILSNAKLNKQILPNYVYFKDDKFLTMLRTASLYNDMERVLNSVFNPITGLHKHKRNDYTKVMILFDESGAVMNGKYDRQFEKEMIDYINQQRKNNQDIYLITADVSQTDKGLRRFVEVYLYSKPLWDFWVFKNIKIVRKQFKDSEDNVRMQKIAYIDENGNMNSTQTPMDYYYTFYRQPSVWSLYDDLYKNIVDKDKYLIDNEMLSKMVMHNPKIKKPLLEFEYYDFLVENGFEMPELQEEQRVSWRATLGFAKIGKAIQKEYNFYKDEFLGIYNKIKLKFNKDA